MPRVVGKLLLAVTVAVSAWTAWFAAHPARVAASSTDSSAATGKGLKWQGVASCSSMACHNMNGPKGSKGSEYSTWVSYHQHSKAFLTLYNERSKRIEKNLKRLASIEQAKPEENLLCLKCHAAGIATKEQQGPNFAMEEGVACESCHGPAEKWLSTHFTNDWLSKTPDEKAAQGMRPTKDLLSRAQICAECHIGAADREVNHDLIAAGHPRLNFEFGAYLANMPKHWQEKGENNRSDFEARVWAIGQVASTQAALELLEARARAAMKPSDGKAPPGEQPVWPEFAEYDCFACHHALRDEEWRRDKRDFTKRRPGSYPWNTWYQAMTPVLAQQWPGADTEQAVKAIDEITTLMSFVRPDPAKVAAKAQSSRKILETWARALDRQEIPAATVNALLATLAGDAKLAGIGWDESAQLYLALCAMNQAHKAMAPSAPDTAVLGQLQKLFEALDFKPGYSSPTGFKADRFRDDVQKLQQLFRQ